MKRYLTFFFLLITSLALCAYPEGAINNIDGSALGWDDTNKVWRPLAVDEDGNLKTDSGESTQEISVDTSNIESYLKEVDGENTITVTDLINGIGTDTSNIESYLKVGDTNVANLTNGIGTDVAVIKTEVSSISHNIGGLLDETIPYFRSQRLSISPETVTQITPVIGSGGSKRVFVELRAVDENSVFYLGFGSGATDSNGRPVKGRVLLNMSTVQNLYVYHTNASAIAIQQTEGWK